MTFLRKHQVVGHTNRDGLWEYNRVHEEGVNWSKAANVQVYVNTTIMVEDKVANSVCTLNWVAVVVERIEEPRIVFRNKFAGASICPEHVSAVSWIKVRGDADGWTGINELTSRASCPCMPGIYRANGGEEYLFSMFDG